MLIVDDEPFNRDILTGVLRSSHFNCKTASSGQEALQMITRQDSLEKPVKVVIMDV